MNTFLLILFKIVSLYAIIYIIYLILAFIRYKGLSSLKGLEILLRLLKISYNQFSFRYFVKTQKYKLIILGHKNFLIFKEFKSELKRNLRELWRKAELFPLKFYNHINHLDIQFEINSFVTQLTSGKYTHIEIYNIYGLDHKDLFRVIYIKIMSDPQIFNKLDKCDLCFIGSSFRDLETNLCRLIKIHPGLNMDKTTSFSKFYNSIIYRYLRTDYNSIEDLDSIYRLEIRIREF